MQWMVKARTWKIQYTNDKGKIAHYSFTATECGGFDKAKRQCMEAAKRLGNKPKDEKDRMK